MNRIAIILIFFYAGIILTFSGCEGFLDERMSKTSSVPTSLADLQALLDAGSLINLGQYPNLLEAGTDNYYVGSDGYAGLNTFLQDIYTFKNPSLYTAAALVYWRNPYRVIAIANTVLDGMGDIEKTAGLNPDHIRGQALFHRGYEHFLLAQVYSLPYDINGDNTRAGLSLRTSSDANIKTVRSSVHETYSSIIADMTEAAGLLEVTSAYTTRPGKVAAYAALSKIYTAMEEYGKATQYATLALDIYSSLIDLNTINVNANYPFPAMNNETVFFAYCSGLGFLSPTRPSFVSKELYDMFQEGDLRKLAYFQQDNNGNITFKGTYMGLGSGSFFTGLTTSELLLDRAESLVRTGKTAAARNDLNTLLRSRWNKDDFVEVAIDEPDDLLRVILDERRKELIMRGVRWSDLRRLNRDPRFRKTITRRLDLNGTVMEFKLPPDEESYVFKIPQEVIDMAGIEQN